MQTTATNATVKVVGTNGQISLGKQFAGRQVLIEEQGVGVWLIRTATVIPDNERWLHEPATASDLGKAMAWAASHPPKDGDTNTDVTLDRLAQAADTFNP